MLEVLKVIILGIVQGITEWLPISSTGHMILVDEFIKLDFSKDTKKIIRTYNNQKIAKSFFYFNPKAKRKEMITNKKTGKEIDEEYIKLIRTESYRFKLENCAESFDISKKTIMEIVNLFLKNSEE